MSDLNEMLATIEEHEIDDHIGRHGWGVVAKKLLKWLRYFMARSCLWKRAAKKWRGDATHADELAAHYMGWWKEAEATSTRRLELLRRCEIWIDRMSDELPGYAPLELLNELAKELSNDNDGEGVS